jgi:hypothetical protein
MDHLNTQEKKLLQGIKPKREEEENAEPSEEPMQAETTTNGVF